MRGKLEQFESYARAVIEECYQMTKTVTVRLVDFGFRLTQLDASAIKPLMIAFDGPPLAFRLLIDSLPKQQKESLCRYATLSVRLTTSREKHFLCWSKTWKATDIKKQNWNKGRNDCSSSMHSSEMYNFNNQHCASSSLGLVTRAFVTSWLNKEHKRAGGRGIEAALSGIAKRHSDLPPSEFALSKADNFINKTLKLQSTQSSDNCLNQLATKPIMKIDNDWPIIARLSKTIRKAPLELLKKESQKKVKKLQAMKEDSGRSVHLNNSNHPDNLKNLSNFNHPNDCNNLEDSNYPKDSNYLKDPDHLTDSYHPSNSNQLNNSNYLDDPNRSTDSNNVAIKVEN
uniref:PAP-associated domain-containing protein n=1 Tax=Loa loa TaxID=7209 RepID=A0A1I7VBY2_LOALO